MNVDSTDQLPRVVELSPPPDPEAAFTRIVRQKFPLFLDSALRNPQLGRYSYLAADPFEVINIPADGRDGLRRLAQTLAQFPASSVPELPPFQGGAAGVLSYDLGRAFERIPLPRFDEFQLPALVVGLYDTVLAFDHVEHRAWLISHGFPETLPAARLARADRRIAQFQAWLSQPPHSSAHQNQPAFPNISQAELAPSFAIPNTPALLSNFSADAYRAAVERAIEYIRAGDIFQVNLAQRLLYPAAGDAVDLYLRLRERNPATFMGYFDFGQAQIVSASPERFISVRNRCVETRPIKGTRPRIRRAEADLFTGDELQASAKDRAENVMIVDLLRNDLSRVCRPESVQVTQLCGLETYEFVQHLVSVVRGELADGRSAIDLVRASFPGGSITGAPKVRAMEIIAELEPTARGPYCGSLGYFGFDGSLDLSILIRTITSSQGWWQMPVGGGIVVASDPQREYEETWHKATGLLRALVP